jgi:predicted RNA-binding protein with RPS1 domain
MPEYERGQVINVTVTGAARWGVLVEVPSGEPGWIESHYLDDVRVPVEDWPSSGTTMDAVVLGPRTNDGRWRLSTRPSVLAAARAGLPL